MQVKYIVTYISKCYLPLVYRTALTKPYNKNNAFVTSMARDRWLLC